MRIVLLLLALTHVANAIEPKTPDAERQTFQLLPGFKADLVASEPNVIDPVAMAFDQRGRLFVCEMIGYSNGGRGTGEQSLGRVRLLTDTNGDGLYETAQTFADNLRFPTGVLPWRNGILVAVAPDILYLQDTNNDGKADQSTVLYTGFGLDNIQQMVNSLQWHSDGWVYGVAGSNGGTITSPQQPKMAPVVLRGRGIRFKPDEPGSLEPTSGGGQYGITCDLGQHWFTATNSQHLRQIVLPDHYLKRQPLLSVPAVVSDIPEHGAACKVFRISPFEAWRVERTTRRKDSPEMAKRLPANELVPGGYVTSGCSPLYYDDPLFPAEYRQTVFVCDPANNLVTRDRLAANGSLYKAMRADEKQEFFASTDNWCRPVNLSVGPDGAIYLLDFYREVIETPLSLPDDIKKTVELQSRGRGRIWRIAPTNSKREPFPTLSSDQPSALVNALHDPRAWVRNTVSRLLYETKPKAISTDLAAGLPTATPATTVELLWALKHTQALTETHIKKALTHPNAAVREHALRLAEPLLATSEPLQQHVASMVTDADSFVRLQLAFTAGELPPSIAIKVLSQLATQPTADSWMQSAILSSSHGRESELLTALISQDRSGKSLLLIGRLLTIVGASHNAGALARVFDHVLLAKPDEQLILLDGLTQGMRNTTRPMAALWANPPKELSAKLTALRPIYAKLANDVVDAKTPTAHRLLAIRMLGSGPADIGQEPLTNLLAPQVSADLQSASVQALGMYQTSTVANALLTHWDSYTPTIRREVLETLTARNDRLPILLQAIEDQKITANQLDSARITLLKQHPDQTIRQRATKLLANAGNADRKKIIDQYQMALTLPGDVTRGREIFRKNCTACHRLENVGHIIGADLTAALRNKTKETLIIDILDPSREVDTRYLNYRVATTAGKTITGILAVETPTSITLKRGDNAEDTVLRSQVEEMKATTKSLMPEEFEKQITPQQLADLFAYLLGPGRDSGK